MHIIFFATIKKTYFRKVFAIHLSQQYQEAIKQKKRQNFQMFFFTVDTYCCCFEQQQPIYIVCMTYVNEYKQNIMKVFSFNLKYLFQVGGRGLLWVDGSTGGLQVPGAYIPTSNIGNPFPLPSQKSIPCLWGPLLILQHFFYYREIPPSIHQWWEGSKIYIPVRHLVVHGETRHSTTQLKQLLRKQETERPRVYFKILFPARSEIVSILFLCFSVFKTKYRLVFVINNMEICK